MRARAGDAVARRGAPVRLPPRAAATRMAPSQVPGARARSGRVPVRSRTQFRRAPAWKVSWIEAGACANRSGSSVMNPQLRCARATRRAIGARCHGVRRRVVASSSKRDPARRPATRSRIRHCARAGLHERETPPLRFTRRQWRAEDLPSLPSSATRRGLRRTCGRARHVDGCWRRFP